MHLPFYIARRYLYAKKTHNAINIITLVTMMGLAVGAMAMVIVMSVTNGLEKLIIAQFNAFHADLEITPAEGKTFSLQSFPLQEIHQIPGVQHIGEILEEQGMIVYRDRQHLVRFRGVDRKYDRISGIDTLIVKGEYRIEEDERYFLVLGNGIYSVLNASVHDHLHPLELFVPRRGRTTGMHPSQAFRSSTNFARGVFAVQAEFDMEYVLLPIALMRQLLEYDDEVTQLAISIERNHNHSRVQRSMQEVVGTDYIVKDRMQQQDFLYKVMRSEKWAIFFILAFILVIAAFNIVGSLTMLVLEKRRDITILRSLGASKKLIERVFLLEGMLISMGGAMAGITLGGFITWLQMRFGLVTIQAEGMFIIDAYPVVLKVSDMALVACTVFLIGWLASLIPLKNIWKSLDEAPA